MRTRYYFQAVLVILFGVFLMHGSFPVKTGKPAFRVLAFCGSGESDDLGHRSFIHEANRWFPGMAKKYNFIYDSTYNWDDLNESKLSEYQVLIFLDSRPDSVYQRKAFMDYMEKGGAWMGFHFAAFALTPSAFPQDWDWYHEKFLGSGQYKSNTWRPTSAVLRVENRDLKPFRKIPETFTASPNEWYRWENDLRKNKDITILLSVDSASFPLGTGPKQYEIWHSGYYPMAWTNRNYRMIYFNMGHNDIDYEGKTNRELSHTFGNPVQDKIVLESLLWLGKSEKLK
jgi:uncharacterized protein